MVFTITSQKMTNFMTIFVLSTKTNWKMTTLYMSVAASVVAAMCTSVDCYSFEYGLLNCIE